MCTIFLLSFEIAVNSITTLGSPNSSRAPWIINYSIVHVNHWKCTLGATWLWTLKRLFISQKPEVVVTWYHKQLKNVPVSLVQWLKSLQWLCRQKLPNWPSWLCTFFWKHKGARTPLLSRRVMNGLGFQCHEIVGIGFSDVNSVLFPIWSHAAPRYILKWTN